MSMQNPANQEYQTGTDPEALSASSYRAVYKSNVSTAGLSGVVEVRIPNVQNAILDCSASYLECSVAATITGTGLAADSVRMSPFGIASAIKQISVSCGSVCVQRFNQFAELYALLRSSNSSVSSFSASSLTEGTAGGNSTQNGMLEGTKLSVVPNGGATAAVLSQLNFSLSIPGLLSGSRSIPVCFLNDSLRVEIIFKDDVRSFLYTSAGSGVTVISGGSVTFSQIGYNARMITLSPYGMQQIKLASGMSEKRPLSWSDISYTTDTSTVDADTLNSATETTRVVKIGGLKPRSATAYYSTGFPSTVSGNCIMSAPCGSGAFSTQLRASGALFPPGQGLVGTAQNVQGAQMASYQFDNPQLTNIYSLNACRQDRAQSLRVQAAAAAFDSEPTPRCVSGYPLAAMADNRGIDVSNSQVELHLRYIKGASVTAVSPIASFFAMRYNVIYSIGSDGSFHVSE